MSENISFVKDTQNTFSTKINKLKKDLKLKNIKVNEFTKNGKLNGRGIVLLKNIPPGFEEKEMKQYFQQFGRVLNVVLVRSIQTGKSKGYAFILFELEEVAKISAETMNNYLMYNHLLKAKYFPSNFKFEQKFKCKRKITRNNCLLNKNMQKIKLIKNTNITNEIAYKRIKRRQSTLKRGLVNLKKAGINYNFEVPEIKFNTENTVEEKRLPILLINQDDKEVIFKTPPNVIKKLVKFGLKANTKNLNKIIKNKVKAK